MEDFEDTTPDEYTVEVTHPDKLMFPDDGITKGDLIDYYEAISDIMFPHMKGRPLTMHRFPDGIDEPGFIQKEAPDYFPHWIERADLETREDEGMITMAVCENAATIIYLANLACITQHIWLSRVDRSDHPDKLVFDLDPDGVEFAYTRWAASALRGLLEDELGLTTFVMSTGSKGLHVVVPLDRSETFDEVRPFAQDVATVLVSRNPDQLTTEQRKEGRAGRIYIDTLRNSYGQTSVAPYSVRALPGAPVATPLEWSELDNPKLTAQTYSLTNICDHLDQRDDPWKLIWQQVCSLDEARERLDSLIEEIAVGGDFTGMSS